MRNCGVRRTLLAILAIATLSGRLSAQVRDVIIDEDGGVDDLVAIALLMQSPAVRVRAITICPGDSYLDQATRATQLFVDRLGGRGVTIAQGHSEGIHPFPAAWRRDAGRVLGIPALAGIKPSNLNPIVSEDAAHYLARLLSPDGTWTILETGPMTNLADALKLNPSIKAHIVRIYAMGGAIRVKGNVEQPGHDGSAEWNIYNQPGAAAGVIQSGIPVTLIPLDATNKVPLTARFIDRLAAQRSIASQLAAQALHLAATQTGGGQYYFWDTLTAAALLDPSIVRIEPMMIRIVTSGASEGRTAGGLRGRRIDTAVDADQTKLETMFLDLLGR